MDIKALPSKPCAHLSEEQVAHIQRSVDDKIAYLQLLTRATAARDAARVHPGGPVSEGAPAAGVFP